MTTAPEKIRRPSATDHLNDLITELSEQAKLRSWNEFVEALDVPGDFYPAIMSGRSELLPRVGVAMSAEEVTVLYKLIGGLIETNMALKRHAEQVAHQVKLWSDAFKQLDSVGRRIQAFANFRRTDEDEEERA